MFDLSRERENPFNPIRGVSLLEWLRSELKDQLEISEPDAEDWGWYSELEWNGADYLIGAIAFFEDGDDPLKEVEWVFQIEKHRSFMDKLLGKNKFTESDSCFLLFKDLLENNSKIINIEVS